MAGKGEQRHPDNEVLVVDDERAIRDALAAELADAGYAVRTARDGTEALRAFTERRPDLVLLDVMMPHMDGFETCRRMREADAATPILFLSALGDDRSQVRGLGHGADDYVQKDCPTSVLLARVAAALRRTERMSCAGDFDFASWRVSSAKMEMRNAAGDLAALSDREIALLRLLASHKGEVLDRRFLQTQLGMDNAGDGVLNVAVSNLRKKLGPDADAIRSVRGAGYTYGNLSRIALT